MKRSNKIISIVLAIVMVFSLLTVVPLSASAAQTGNNRSSAVNPYSNIRYRVLDDEAKTAEITAYGNTTGTVTIPSQIDSFTIVSVAKEAFYGCSDMLEIYIPNTVTSIGDSAFANCTGLLEVVIPPSVTSIGSNAFSGCTRLYRMSVDEGNTVYDSRDNCRAIIETATNTLVSGCKASKIPDTVTKIGAYAFAECHDLCLAQIPDSVTEIGDNAFSFCDELLSVNIPASVERIGDCAFIGCDDLSDITVDPANPVYDSRDNCNAIIDTDENSLLYGCPYSTIPDTVTAIAPKAFLHCHALKEITIPDSITMIGSYAFSNCKKLESIIIPDSVAIIDCNAFEYCKRLQSVVIGNGLEKISSNTFFDCEALSELKIGSKVRDINDNAFFDCTSLMQVTIPSNVCNIASHAFGYYSYFYWACMPMDNFTICGSANSAAQAYAESNGFSFCTLA